ncbi:MAG: TVP38/TMEM64 family protein [Alkalilacustris sp.]
MTTPNSGKHRPAATPQRGQAGPARDQAQGDAALPRARRPWRALILVAILAVAVGVTLSFGDGLGYEVLRDNRETLLAFRDANFLLTATMFVAAYVLIVLFAIPGALVASLTGGFLFGLFPGAVFNIVSATVGSILIFLAVRWGLGARMAARMEMSDGKMHSFKKAIDANAFSAVMTVRLIPVIPFFATNIAAALLGMRLAPFASATALGVIPGGVIYTWVGAGLGEVFERGETPNLAIIFEWPILGPLLGLAALSALPTVLRLWRRRERPHV